MKTSPWKVISLQIYIAIQITYTYSVTAGEDSYLNQFTEQTFTDSLYLARKRWADTAYDFMKNLNCSSIYFTSQEECHHLSNIQKRGVVVYIAQQIQPTDKEFIAVLPDGGLTKGGTHAGVVVLDPYPRANFGHLVLVFFVDPMDRETCEEEEGVYMDEEGECLQLALKHRCKNALERRWRKERHRSSDRFVRKMIRKCEVNFIPHVYPKSHREPPVVDGISQGYPQHLTCRDDLLEFSLCPDLRPTNETSELVCNPIRDNTRRCETTHEAVGTRCRMFESCDQAVIISGGWNRQTSRTHHRDNVVNMFHLLRRNGFHQQAIKVFYANGMHRGIQEESGQDTVNTEILPAAMKTSMQLHIRRMCSTPHCVDTLVLYLNSPSKTDGTMLLWDVDKDGKADDKEQYTVDELLVDLQGCKAKSVQIIADQSFSGEIVRAIRKSKDHNNVVAFSSGRDHEYSYESTFTDHWVSVDHSHLCTQNVFQQVKSLMLESTPEMGTKMNRNSEGPGPVTLFGAPCNVDPPFSENELKLYYRGCQNVPTEVWLRTFFASTTGETISQSLYRRRFVSESKTSLQTKLLENLIDT